MRAGIQVNGDPPMYEFNEPTKWLLASGVVPTVPSPPRKAMTTSIVHVESLKLCITLHVHVHVHACSHCKM